MLFARLSRLSKIYPKSEKDEKLFSVEEKHSKFFNHPREVYWDESRVERLSTTMTKEWHGIAKESNRKYWSIKKISHRHWISFLLVNSIAYRRQHFHHFLSTIAIFALIVVIFFCYCFWLFFPFDILISLK